VKRARELIYTAERQESRDVGLAGLRLKPGSSHRRQIEKVVSVELAKANFRKLIDRLGKGIGCYNRRPYKAKIL
jgi:hypothetical protein